MERRHTFPMRSLLLLIPAIMLLSLVLSACGNGESSDDDVDMATTDHPTSGMAVEEAAADEDMAYFATDDAEGERSQADDPGAQVALDRLVIRTAQITLTVEDTLSATGSVRNLAITKGGFVFSSSTYVEDDSEYAQLTLRVPSDRFDETIDELRSAPYVTKVIREESSSQDVSSEFVDNESRLTALEETQRRYMALLSEADTVDEILRLESELTSVRSQIETIKGRQNYLGEMTSLSTITVTLRPVDGEEEEPEEGFAIMNIIESAWDRSTGALAGVAEAIIVIAIFGVFFAPFGFLLYLLFRFARRRFETRVVE